MDQQEVEQSALCQVAAGVALAMLAVVGATVWLFSRQTPDGGQTPDGDRSVFKPITEPDVQEDAGQFEDTEETEGKIVT